MFINWNLIYTNFEQTKQKNYQSISSGFVKMVGFDVIIELQRMEIV